MKRFAMLFLLITALSVQAQDYATNSKRAIRSFEKARELFMLRQDREAEEYLLKAVDIDTSFVEAWFMLAQIELDRKNTLQAAAYYLRGVNADPGEYGAGYLKVAELEYTSGKYLQARKHLDKWRESGYDDAPSLAQAQKLEQNIDFSIDATSHPVPFNPVEYRFLDRCNQPPRSVQPGIPRKRC